ncbi:hypothetical protein M0811_01417 [Anaeramoeba ignava]|uniref:Uncharacterized protein n=1 Tax=Anaeramoeba ignava TaxID=1746090 RepID=A0A9Q0RAE3_ANAIG|nr:hypothetical protein M0811_01417 [Anaeramoeba ignava]
MRTKLDNVVLKPEIEPQISLKISDSNNYLLNQNLITKFQIHLELLFAKLSLSFQFKFGNSKHSFLFDLSDISSSLFADIINNQEIEKMREFALKLGSISLDYFPESFSKSDTNQIPSRSVGRNIFQFPIKELANESIPFLDLQYSTQKEHSFSTKISSSNLILDFHVFKLFSTFLSSTILKKLSQFFPSTPRKTSHESKQIQQEQITSLDSETIDNSLFLQQDDMQINIFQKLFDIPKIDVKISHFKIFIESESP